MARMTGGTALVKGLIANGIHTLFGLPGVQMDAFYNALFDAGSAVRVIQTRHEQGAGYMALGWARATGGVGCYAVVPGPGFLNASAALCTAYATNAKVLCVCGQIPTPSIGKGIGLLHEIPDQLGVMRSLTKWAERIAEAGEVPAKLGEALRQLHAGRPRPVAVEMAMDVMAREGEVGPFAAVAPDGHPPVDADAVAEGARLLGQAKAPLIFVGGGAVEAREQVAALAELLQAPVISGRMGRGVLSSRHALSHTLPVGYKLWAQADVVLAVGTRLQIPLMNWGVDDDLKIVRVDIDPDEAARVAPPAVSIVADAGDALRALLPQIERHNRKRASREDELRGLAAQVAGEYAFLEPQLSFLRAIRAELPDDGVLVDELTQVGYVGRFALPVYGPRTYLSSGYQGTLGWGLATAIGAKLARPELPLVALAGDGGFMFNVQELATAVQQEAGVVSIVFNDGAYGNVKRMQKELYGNRVIASDLRNPDFVKLAEAFGAQGLRARSPEELRGAIRQGLATRGPTVIDVPVGEMPDPWAYIYQPRLRGQTGRGGSTAPWAATVSKK
jgi:acetolactate synthase I/II/III large subunit